MTNDAFADVGNIGPHRNHQARQRVAILIALEASTLAIMSIVHLTGVLAGGTDAGVAEALICVALIAGATVLARDPVRGRRIARATIVFAILGFIVGLSSTIQDGDGAIDIAYHATVLPLLVITLAALVTRPSARPGAASRAHPTNSIE